MAGSTFSQKVLVGGTTREDGQNGPLVWSSMALPATVAAVFSESQVSVLGKGLIYSLHFIARLKIPIMQF